MPGAPGPSTGLHFCRTFTVKFIIYFRFTYCNNLLEIILIKCIIIYDFQKAPEFYNSGAFSFNGNYLMKVFSGNLYDCYTAIKDVDNLINPNFRFLSSKEKAALNYFKDIYNPNPCARYKAKLKEGADCKKFLKDPNLHEFVDYFYIHPILKDNKMFFVIVPFGNSEPICRVKNGKLIIIASIVDNLDDFDLDEEDKLIYKNILLKYPSFSKNYSIYKARFFRSNSNLIRNRNNRPIATGVTLNNYEFPF